jgi:hypothetical protein
MARFSLLNKPVIQIHHRLLIGSGKTYVLEELKTAKCREFTYIIATYYIYILVNNIATCNDVIISQPSGIYTH